MFIGQDIFRGTILENLTMGNKNITMEEITNLADMLGFTEFIIINKNGYDTQLDPTGTKLSNYVIQNIKLIRALLNKPCLLLLEEPFQHLNDDRQNALMNYFKKESDATIIIISNNKIVHQQSDVVLAIEDGVLK